MSDDKKNKMYFKKPDWFKESADALGEIVMVFGLSLVALFGLKETGGSAFGLAIVVGLATAAFGFFGVKCHTLGSAAVHLLGLILRLWNQRETKRERMNNITRLIFEIFRILFQILAALLAGVVFKAVAGEVPLTQQPASMLLTEGASVALYGLAVMFDMHLINFPAIMVEDVFGVGFNNGFAQFTTTFFAWSVIRIPTNYGIAFAFWAASNFTPNAMFGWAHLAILIAIGATFLLYVLIFSNRFSPEAIKEDQKENGGVAAPILSEGKKKDDILGSSARAIDHW